MYAQSYTYPSYPEYINPSASTPGHSTVVVPHVSCYSAEDITFYYSSSYHEQNNLYVWAWGGLNSGSSSSGIAWKRTDVGGGILNDGNLMLPTPVIEPEIAFINADDHICVYLAYYLPSAFAGNPPGHYYNLYSWDAGGINLISDFHVLSSSSQYSRISIDAHRLHDLAMVWQTDLGLNMKLFSANTGGATIASTPVFHILGTDFDTRLPDIAFGKVDIPTNKIMMRIAFVDADGILSGFKDIDVISQDFNLLFGSSGPASIAWNVDDIKTNAFLYDPSVVDFGNEGNNLQLDCPDNYPQDAWGYIYLEDGFTVRARVYQDFMIYDIDSLDYMLEGSPKNGLAIAYEKEPRRVNFGWGMPKIGQQNFIGVTYQMGSTAIKQAPANNYKIIQNSPYLWPNIGLPTFSKQSFYSKNLFAVYNLRQDDASIVNELRTKLVPYPTLAYSFSHPKANSKGLEDYTIMPNPSNAPPLIVARTEGFSTETMELLLMDLKGEVMLNSVGNLSSINKYLLNNWSKIPPGLYHIRLVNDETSNLHVLKIVKL